MSTTDDRSNAPRSRTLLVSFLGAVVRRFDDWMPISGVVELMGQCELDAPGVRTAVSRLKKRGWLEPEARNGVRGYRLTPLALDELSAGDQVIWHAREAADLTDGWCVVNFSVPEVARARRHQLRTHLESLGFGNVGSGVWIAPARMLEAAEKAIAELDLTEHCAIFVGSYAAGKPLPTLIAEAWDLSAIDDRYRSFLTDYRPRLQHVLGSDAVTPSTSFAWYLDVVDHWRKLPYRDPSLPLEVLPDSWSGPAATELFEDLVTALRPAALAHAETYW